MEYHSKIAPNTTSGAHKGGMKTKHNDSFEASSSALEHTPYAKKQAMYRNKDQKVMDKNLKHLKQD